MSTFKKKLIVRAVESTFTPAQQTLSCIVPETEAVFMYPYYTPKEKVKTIKVRYVEEKYVHEVIDFNLYLSTPDFYSQPRKEGSDER